MEGKEARDAMKVGLTLIRGLPVLNDQKPDAICGHFARRDEGHDEEQQPEALEKARAEIDAEKLLRSYPSEVATPAIAHLARQNLRHSHPIQITVKARGGIASSSCRSSP